LFSLVLLMVMDGGIRTDQFLESISSAST
jgi:hypothetical protein